MNQPCLLLPQRLPRAALVTHVSRRYHAEPQGQLWTCPGIGTEQGGEVQGQEAAADLYSSCQEDQWTSPDHPAPEAEDNFGSWVQSMRCLRLQILQNQCRLKDWSCEGQAMQQDAIWPWLACTFSHAVSKPCLERLQGCAVTNYLPFTVCSSLCIDRSHA